MRESESVKFLHIVFCFFSIPKVAIKETFVFSLRDISLLLRVVLVQENVFWFLIDPQSYVDFKDVWFM